MLIDPLVGVLKKVAVSPATIPEPTGLTCVTAVVGDLGRVSRWQPDATGGGMGFDADAARGAAIGEALERYCGNMISRVDVTARAAALGRARVLPADLAVFRPHQYLRPGFPFTPVDDSTEVDWVAGQEMATGAEVLLPAPSVYLNYYRGIGGAGPSARKFPVLLPGIAAGRDFGSACRSALLEIIERDVTTRWWIGGSSATVIDFPADHAVRRTVQCGLPPEVSLWWLLLPSEFAVPTVAGVLIDEEREILAVGFATRPSIDDAALKACAEAFQLRRIAADVLDEDSCLWRSARRGVPFLPLKPYRRDRAYRGSFAPDWSDMTQLAHNLQYFLDTSTWGAALCRLQVPDRVDRAALGSTVREWSVDDLVAHCGEFGLSCYSVDLTTDDVTAYGYSVARVVVPAAVPNLPAAFPPLASARLPDGLDLSPMPHA